MNRKLKQWIAECDGRICKRKPFFFVLPHAKEPVDTLKTERLFHFDEILEKTLILKDSATTTAGLAAFTPDGDPVFMKRTNNKGLKFTLRYLFRPARVFRAAMAADAFARIGIRTPRVLAAGERRSCGLILRAGYLLTSSSNDLHSVHTLFHESGESALLLDSFLRYAAPTLAALHARGIVHGDLKLSNFYYLGRWTPQEAAYGIWDLDGVRRFEKQLPERLILRELARVISSILIESDGNPAFPASFYDLNALSERLCASYRSALENGKAELPAQGERAMLSPSFVPEPALLIPLVLARLEREPGMKHSYRV